MNPREINIAWFKNLTDVLASYMEVLRYEMRQGAGAQTVEALIHAEIYKILIREFPSDCIRSEFRIGHHFLSIEAAQQQAEAEDGKKPQAEADDGKKPQAEADDGKKPQAEADDGKNPKKISTGRQFRADIAIFHPLQEPQHGVHATVHPIAIFELKRTGDAKALHDDVYRLAIVTAKIATTGYFLMAAPLAQLLELIRSLEIFSGLVSVQAPPAEIEFTKMQPVSSLYHEVDHQGAVYFHAKLMFATDEVAEALKGGASSSSPGPGEAAIDAKDAETVDAEEIDNAQAQGPYAYVIYGIAGNKSRLTEETNHRMAFTLNAAPERIKPVLIEKDLGLAPKASDA